ncbi:MAG: hypothetical protein KA264_06840 [Crocinitomicaceae bacterium]|jgi:hypothetical protein|nr:hypothetical protein [Crocinitomicaceae bacterium]
MSEIQETKPKSNGALLLILIVLLIALAYMAFSWSKKNKALNECSNANKELEADMQGMNDMMSGYVGNMSNDLRKDFQQMLNTYDALKVKDSAQAQQVIAQKEKIQSLMNQLSSGKKLSAQQIYSLRKENETLRGIMKGYVKQIDSLNTMNVKLSSDLETKTQELTTTTSERDQYKSQAEESATLVKKGSKLQALGFNSGALRMKINNTTEPTNKAKSAVQLKAGFTVTANPLTKPGMKKVYLQITAPDGRVLQDKETNVVNTDGGTVAFSDKKDIDYNNENVDVTIYYDVKEGEVTKGNYKVKIICEGQVIGTDSFTLK